MHSDNTRRVFPVAEGDKFNSRWQRHRNPSKRRSDPERVEYCGEFDPFRVGTRWCPKPVALPPATEFVAFGDSAIHPQIHL